MQKKLKHVVTITISSILALIILICFLLVFFSIVPIKKVSYNIDNWQLLQEENSYLPKINEMGNYKSLECKHQRVENLIISSNTYILKVAYSENEFMMQKEYIENTYFFQEKVEDKIDKSVVTKDASFSIDGFDFKMLSLDAYNLYYPKRFVFVGSSEEENTVCFVFFEDMELDYIRGSFEDFFKKECGW